MHLKALYHSDMEASVYAIKTNYFTFNLLAWLFIYLTAYYVRML